MRHKADFVIVGTGAGGATAGKELAERGHSVIFVEEGAAHPPNSHRDLANDALKRLYRNQGVTLAIGNPGFPLLLGSCVGGTTVVNGGTCLRPRPELFARWVGELGLGDLSEAVLAPHYDAIERDLGVRPAEFAVMSRTNTLIHEVFSKEGLPGRPLPRNAIDCKGCGMCCYGCTSGAKQSMDVSFIPRAIAAGAKIFASCRAEKIAERLVIGRKLDGSKEWIEFRARHAVILAAGSVHTPFLLKKNRLSRSPQLGRNLTVHPASKVYAEFDEDILGWNGTPQAYVSDSLHDRGILFEGVFVPPDIAATMNPFQGARLHEFMRSYRKMATFGFMIEDSGSGRVVRLPLIGDLVGPLILYSLKPADVAKIQEASVFLARLLLRHGARRVIPMLYRHDEEPELRSEADVARFERTHFRPEDVELAAFHPLGTARIGRNEREGVVDPSGRVFGTESIYVADGSTLPTALGVNPQLTIMAFARRLAHAKR